MLMLDAIETITEKELGVASWQTVPGGYVAMVAHLPHDDYASGCVVLAPSFGREAAVSHLTMRALAITLARHGIATFRFSWRGDGDSSPLPGDDVASAWCDDLRAVCGRAAASTGIEPYVIGLRVGAAVAAAVPTGGGALWWEPEGGRSWVRRQEMVRKLSLEVPALDDVVELPGASLRPAQADSLKRLKIPKAPPANTRVREETDRRVAERFYAIAPHLSEVPREAIAEMCHLVPTGPQKMIVFTPELTAERVVDGVTIVDEHTFVGPHRLPAIHTRPVDVEPSCALVFTGSGSEAMSGPTSLWAQLAGPLAAAGALVWRADRRGQGEAYDGIADHEPNPYTYRGVSDVAAVLGAARLDAPTLPLLAVGSCVGNWLFSLAAKRADFDKLLSFSPFGWHLSADYYDRNLSGRRARSLASLQSDATPSGRWAKLRPQVRKLRHTVPRMVPESVWRIAGRVGAVEHPLVLLRQLPRTLEVTFHLGDDDAMLWRKVRGPAALRVLERRGHSIAMSHHSGLDHALLSQRARLIATDIIHDAVASLAARTAPGTGDRQ